MGSLTDRVAVVTGAGDGIGEAIALRFAADDAKGILCADLNYDAAVRVADAINATFGSPTRAVAAEVDVSSKGEVLAMIDSAVSLWGGIDVLVNNAWGGGTLQRVEHKSDTTIAHGFGVGFYGPLWAMQAAYALMKAAGYGRIINLCSLNGVNAHMGTLEYNAAKEALRALTRTAAREWAPSGVVVNAICPGAKTAASRRVFAQHPELEIAADASNPMGRLGGEGGFIRPRIAERISAIARSCVTSFC